MIVHRDVPLARRTMFQERRRAVLGIAGVAVALSLTLILSGIFDAAMRQVTAYIRSSPADVVVSQRGVRTMHMSASALDPGTVDAVAAVAGVEWAGPLGFVSSAYLDASGGRELTYVIGYDTATGRGGPPRLESGRPPERGEVIVDRAMARRMGIGVGDRVALVGIERVVSGLTRGLSSMVNTTTFVPLADLAMVRGDAISYVLVGADDGTNAAALAARIQSTVPGVTAQTRDALADQEGRLVRDMSTDVLRLMTLIGLLIALAVVALTLFTVTLARVRDYGIAKAIGAGRGRLLRVVLAQAAWTVGIGLVAAVALAALLGRVVSAADPTLAVDVTLAGTARTTLGAVAVGGLAALLPLRRVLTVDPATVFRRAA